MAISPIPSTRVSEQLIRSRLILQLQVDQREMFRIQTQVTTGRRIFLPSEDAPAAMRAIGLQRLLERKTQVTVNLTTNQSYLSATDAALSAVSGLLSDIRGQSLAVADTISSDSQREAVAASVSRALDQMIDTGNQRFRGRYLFAGTRTTVAPFEQAGGFVSYEGNEGELRSYSDIDVLFESSINGNDVFGAISEPVLGSADLNPALDENTRLTDLRGGQGISVGSISISDGLNSRVIDISPAQTMGDLARLIETNPPSGRTLTVNVTPIGLDVTIDGGNLQITEVAGGTTASELGILREGGAPETRVIGQDLDPVLRLTTPLEDVFGARAFAWINSPGNNNDFKIEAAANGADLNGVTVQFVDDRLLQAAAGLSPGSETAIYHENAQSARAAIDFSGDDNDLILTAKTPGVEYNDVNIVVANAGDVKDAPTATFTDVGGVRTLTLGIDDTGETSLQALVDAIDASTPFTASSDTSGGEGFDGAGFIAAANVGIATGNTGNSGGAEKTLYVHIAPGGTNANGVVDAINAEGTFSAQLDPRDTVLKSQAGFGPIDVDATAVTTGGSGFVFDKESGIQIANGGQNFDISFTTAQTVEDLLNIINGAGAGALAELNAEGTGINVRSRLSGADFSIGENGGFTATELGIRSFTGATQLDTLNYGRGVQTVDGTDFTIVSNNGTELQIDLTGARTIEDVLNRINDHPDNVGGPRVTAQLARYGNGIELVDDNPTGLDAEGQPNTLAVERATLSLAAVHLGLVPPDEDHSLPPTPATTPIALASLTGPNTALQFTSNQAGTDFGEVRIVLVNNAAVGDQALVNYDGANKILTIDVDPAATTASTVAAAVNAGGVFTAELDDSGGPNDGTGLIVDVGTVATTSAGAPEYLTGGNVHPQETHGVFNSLIRLQTALESNNLVDVQRALAMIDEDIGRVNFARAEVGARQQGLDVLQSRQATEEIELRDALSIEIDVDFAQAISDMSARQYAYEAALRTTATTLQQTLLSYL